jgi:preprotein translocase subunit SecD
MRDLESELRDALDDAANRVRISPGAFAEQRRRQSSRPRRRLTVGLSVAGIAVVTALVVVGAMVFSGGGNQSPQTLASDKSVVLTPSRHLSAAGLATSASILTRRLTALGVRGAKVRSDGNALRATVPAGSVSTLRTVAEAAGVLRFRQVREAATPVLHGGASDAPVTGITEAPSVTPHLLRSFAKWDCVKDANPTKGQDLASDYIIACDGSTNQVYLLAPAAIEGGQISGASDGVDSTGQWVVNLSFTGSGAHAWQQLTAKTYNVDGGTPDVGSTTGTPCAPLTGCNAISITLDGSVTSAPYSTQRGGIPGGQTQISGSFTRRQATELADVLQYGALPTSFRVGA